MTALLVELAEGLPMHDVSEFIVAHGQDIPNFCRAMFQTVDKFGNTRKKEGHVTEVHKPLAVRMKSASTTTHPSSENLVLSFPDTAELQKATGGSIIDCVTFMVIVEFCLCVGRAGKWRWHQWNRIKTS